MLTFLTIPFIAYMFAIFSVAIVGEFIEKDGKITQEYIAWLIITSGAILIHKIRKK